MSKVLITGATGFLGAEIARQAVAAGYEVVALRRKTSSVARLGDLPVRYALGDVTDAGSLVAAMEGVAWCIHAAGDTSYFLRDRARLRQINVEGVRNVVAAARAAGVRRLVHTSSVAAIGYDPRGRPVDETAVWNWPRGLPYMETKRDGERIALAAAGPGFAVIALNPATIFGPGGMNASESQLLREIRTGRLPAAPPGGMTVCDVSDVAAAHVAALERGRSGHRYILGGPHVTHRALIEAFARAFGVAAPARTAPGWLIALIGAALLGAERLGLPLATPAASVRLSRFGIYHASDKAVAELGYRIRPLEEVVARTANGKPRGSPAARSARARQWPSLWRCKR